MKKAKSRTGGIPKRSRARPKTVADYLAGVPAPARTTLLKIRSVIRAAVPRAATETISYGIPAFRTDRILVWYAAFTNHCSVFPTGAVLQAFTGDLAGYVVSKGTVQFPIDRPPPVALIRKLVRARVAALTPRTTVKPAARSRVTRKSKAANQR
jgi:uncharacterized protein YdhG (YjbR/CyaY superfamily)